MSPSDELIDAARKARAALYELEDALDAQWSTRYPLSDGEFSELRRLSIRLENDTVRKIERVCQEHERANTPEGDRALS